QIDNRFFSKHDFESLLKFSVRSKTDTIPEAEFLHYRFPAKHYGRHSSKNIFSRFSASEKLRALCCSCLLGCICDNRWIFDKVLGLFLHSLRMWPLLDIVNRDTVPCSDFRGRFTGSVCAAIRFG